MKRFRTSYLIAAAFAAALMTLPFTAVSTAHAQSLLKLDIQQGHSELGLNTGILNLNSSATSFPNGTSTSTTTTGINLGPLLQNQSTVTSTGTTFSDFLAALFGALF